MTEDKKAKAISDLISCLDRDSDSMRLLLQITLKEYGGFRNYMLALGDFKPCPACGKDGWDNCPECT